MGKKGAGLPWSDQICQEAEEAVDKKGPGSWGSGSMFGLFPGAKGHR